MKEGINIPADALGAAIQASTAISAAPAPVPLTHTIIQSSLNAGHGVRAAALAKSAISSLTYAGLKWFALATVAIILGTTVGGTWLAVSRGQSSPSAAAVPAPTTAPTTVAADVLAIGDRLKVSISDLKGPGIWSTYTPLVDPDGTTSVPLIPPIPVQGLTTSAVVDKIRQGYSDAQLIRNASATVTRIEQANAPLTGRGPLKAGDKIVCRILDLQGPGIESKFHQTIPNDGKIALPHIDGIAIAGKLESEAAVAIDDAYRKANLISNAQVEVVREQPEAIAPNPQPAVGGER